MLTTQCYVKKQDTKLDIHQGFNLVMATSVMKTSLRKNTNMLIG